LDSSEIMDISLYNKKPTGLGPAGLLPLLSIFSPVFLSRQPAPGN
jgi:hypothetical protein